VALLLFFFFYYYYYYYIIIEQQTFIWKAYIGTEIEVPTTYIIAHPADLKLINVASKSVYIIEVV